MVKYGWKWRWIKREWVEGWMKVGWVGSEEWKKKKNLLTGRKKEGKSKWKIKKSWWLLEENRWKKADGGNKEKQMISVEKSEKIQKLLIVCGWLVSYYFANWEEIGVVCVVELSQRCHSGGSLLQIQPLEDKRNSEPLLQNWRCIVKKSFSNEKATIKKNRFWKMWFIRLNIFSWNLVNYVTMDTFFIG